MRDLRPETELRPPSWACYAVALVLANVLDACGTLWLLARGAEEVMVGLAPIGLGHLSPAGFVAAKACWSGLLVATLRWCHARGSRIALPGVRACCALYLAVLAWQVGLLVGS